VSQNVLEINDLKVHFRTDDGVVKAVDGVTFNVRRSITLGIVGESGSGKSVTGLSILRLVSKSGELVSGEVLFYEDDQEEPIDLAALNRRRIRDYRGEKIAMIFQEPMSSLTPVYTIGEQIVEAILAHKRISKQDALQRGIEMLRLVGIPKPEERIHAYTFQLSGGMRQRAMIAMALALNPKLLIADEPTTALDVTTQAQIMALMKDLQGHLGMSIILVTHDLGVVAESCDEVVVMYLGEVVEQAPVDALFHDPSHPYTRALMASIPKLDGDVEARLNPIEGNVPSPHERPSGCLFHTRCSEFMPGKCDQIHPRLQTLDDGRRVRCLLYEEESTDGE